PDTYDPYHNHNLMPNRIQPALWTRFAAGKALADGILSRPHGASEGFVYEHNQRSIARVFRSKVATRLQRHASRAEVARRDDAQTRINNVRRIKCLALRNQSVAISPTVKRCARDNRCSVHSWKILDIA